MKEMLKRGLKPVLFTLAGSLAGLGMYYAVGCSSGGCAVMASPVTSMLYMGFMGYLLCGMIGKGCGDGCSL